MWWEVEMQAITSALAGLLFGLGLVVSGLINPAKVLAFLDVAGQWDPSLAIVMAAAVVTTAIGYKLVIARGRPLLTTAFQLPKVSDIDAPLLTGAAVFGIGWGLVGYCPGPAIAALSLGSHATLIFVAAMIVGMVVARTISAPSRSAPTTRQG
jgi:uncharacterized membrane protein YedE/YeeE